jgi:hypothetical protein
VVLTTRSTPCTLKSSFLSLRRSKSLHLRTRAHGRCPAILHVTRLCIRSPPKAIQRILPQAETVIRGTLRYQGFPEFIKALVQSGLSDPTEKEWLKEGPTWVQLAQKVIRAHSATSHELRPTHPDTLWCVEDFAGFYRSLGRNSEADALLG